MNKFIFAISMLFIATGAFSSTKVVNAFYDAKTAEFAVNYLKDEANQSMSFIRTSKFLVKTQTVELCKVKCEATLRSEKNKRFSIIVAGNKISEVVVSDPDSLLNSEAFTVIGNRLLVNLDIL